MRIAVLWIELTGYLNACLKELVGRPGVELFVVHTIPGPNSPFYSGQFDWIPLQLVWQTTTDLRPLESRLEEFRPDVIVFAGWSVPAYRSVAKRWGRRSLRIMTMDNCWCGTPRQLIASLMARRIVHTIADAIWVPGERQVVFAKRLQFKQTQILRGLYSCDYTAFAKLHERRIGQGLQLKRAFIFIGRMVERKGILTLLAGYRLYRKKIANPWPLICYGRGPLASRLASEIGVVFGDYVQPDALPQVLAETACLVMPSSFEAWAVAVHEAAAAGRIVIASDAVGSGPHLIQDSYNGFIFAVDDADELAKTMVRVSSLSDEKLNAMSAASHSLAQQFTPVRWADTLMEFVERATRSCLHA